MTKAELEARADDFVTVCEFASLVRVCEKTIYRRLKKRTQAGAYRVGGQWRIDVTAAILPHPPA